MICELDKLQSRMGLGNKCDEDRCLELLAAACELKTVYQGDAGWNVKIVVFPTQLIIQYKNRSSDDLLDYIFFSYNGDVGGFLQYIILNKTNTLRRAAIYPHLVGSIQIVRLTSFLRLSLLFSIFQTCLLLVACCFYRIKA